MFLADKLDITSEREYTDEGFLQVPARISRTGIQDYLAIEMGLSDRDPKDIIKVYRPEEEVFNDKSLSSFANKPVTNNHPPELVNAKNAKHYTVGMSGPKITQDGMFAKAILHITDAESIEQIESGKVELSNGYTADIEWVSGVTPEGENYDAVQRNIRGNHIAIVERGRAGSACRVADNLPTTGDILAMAKITINGVDFEVSDQAAQAVAELQASYKDMEKETEEKDMEMKKKKEDEEEMAKKAKKTEDFLKAQLDDAESKIPSAEMLDQLVAERTALIDSARKVLPELNWEGKDAEAIRKEVVAAKCPTVQLDSVSSDYVAARFDMLVETVANNSQHQLDGVFYQQVKTIDSKEDNRPLYVIARENMMTDSRNAWKTGGAK